MLCFGCGAVELRCHEAVWAYWKSPYLDKMLGLSKVNVHTSHVWRWLDGKRSSFSSETSQVGGQIKTQDGEGQFLLEAYGRSAETWGRLLPCAHGFLYCTAKAWSLRWHEKRLSFRLFQLESSLNPLFFPPLHTHLVCLHCTLTMFLFFFSQHVVLPEDEPKVHSTS